jgi:hypothetical protein
MPRTAASFAVCQRQGTTNTGVGNQRRLLLLARELERTWGKLRSERRQCFRYRKYGPVFSYRKFERLTPYAHAQFGAVHGSVGYLGISASAFKFAMTAGGGVDINLNPRVAIRVQGDYLMTRFLDLRQDNLQFSSGLVVHFGRK